MRTRTAGLLLCLVGVVSVAVAADSDTFLLHVERLTQHDAQDLLRGDVAVVHEMETCLFVEGDLDQLRWLDDRGFRSVILDDDPGRSDYLVAGLRPDADLGAAQGLGTVLLQEDNWIVVKVERGTPFEAMSMAGMFVTRMPHDPMLPAREGPTGGPSRGAEQILVADPIVQKVVDQVRNVDIDQYWVDLTDNPPTGTRFSSHQGCEDAAAYCHAEYGSLGIPAEYMDYSASYSRQVIATQQGAIWPDRVYIIEGHLDDLPSTPPAPGADDNASGSVTVLAAARAMSCWAVRNTVKYLNVTGEEQGLNGSEAYADDAWARGEDIRGVINMDMNGWAGDGNPSPENLDINYNGPSEWLGLLFADSAETYATGLAVDAFYCPSLSASDHYPFWQKGWHAICGITDNEGYCGHGGNYPYYHTSDDTIANCGDPTFFYGAVRTSVATLAVLAEPFKVTLGRPQYGCGSDVDVVVGDRDLNADPGTVETVAVEVWSDTEITPETVTLAERGTDSMVFDALVPTTSGEPVAGDGALVVQPGDVVHARYVDALDCDGASDVDYTATAIVECTPPVISSVGAGGITDTTATITWTTDEDADSVVRWGETTPPGQIAADAVYTSAHAIGLSGLQECTVYHYAVESADPAGNLAVETNGGGYFHFETYGDFGAGLQPCHAGRVTLLQGVVNCESNLPVRLVDMDLNLDAGVADTATVTVSSSTETTPEIFILTETGPNSSTFTGSIVTTPGPAVVGDGVLQTADGDLLTATYRDADDGTQAPATSFDTGLADCAGPGYASVWVSGVGDDVATVNWTTSEPTTGTVEWGTTPALGNQVASGTLQLTHAVAIGPFPECERVYFRVVSTDAYGHTMIADTSGAPFEFNAATVGGVVFRDDYVSDAGWTLQGEWEIGEPLGLGPSPGDPDGSFNDTRVLGHDLSGQGDYPGEYEPGSNESATSPEIDASALASVELRFRRWLNVGSTGVAYVQVGFGGGWAPLWNSPSTGGFTESTWAEQTLDVTPYAAGVSDFQVRFLQTSGFRQSHDGGWNIDRLIVRDASTPLFDTCGGCGGAPTFAGVATVADVDPCADTGTTLTWARAPAWGTGSGGTYTVYRDTTPGFAPGPGNLLASGVAGTSWTDATAPNGVTLYYVVRAENDEACATGPANGGTTDDNLVYAAAMDEISQPSPGDVGPTLLVGNVNDAHARLTWTAAPTAAAYHVYRSASPASGFGQVGAPAATLYEDADVFADNQSRYYLVRAADACGNEGP